MESFATAYPLMLNDGEKEMEKGVVGIHSCLTFKRFQSMVGQKAGFPPAQLATIFVCKRTAGGTEKKQSIPINEKTNFGIIVSQHNPKEKDCFFLVSLKRSKKERKTQKKRVDAGCADDETSSAKEDAAKVAEETSNGDTAEEEEIDPGRPHVPLAAEERSPTKRPQDACPKVDGARVSNHQELPRTTLSSGPQAQAAPEPSAWKKGSLLQRLSSAEEKSSTSSERHYGERGSSPDAPDVPCRAFSFKSMLTSESKSSGTVSPTSVLDPSQLPSSFPAGAPSSLAVGPSSFRGGDQGSFQLFGSKLDGVDLRLLVQDAMSMHHKGSRWCKFCAFCRERSMAAPPFHWCVDDQVVSGLRGPNPAGPIGTRPMKQKVAAA